MTAPVTSPVLQILSAKGYTIQDRPLHLKTLGGVVATPDALLDEVVPAALAMPAEQMLGEKCPNIVPPHLRRRLTVELRRSMPVMVAGDSRHPTLIVTPNAHTDYLLDALVAAAEQNYSSIVFTQLFGVDSEEHHPEEHGDERLMASALLAFANEDPKESLREIIVLFEEESAMQVFFDEFQKLETEEYDLEADQDPDLHAEEVAAYLAEKNRQSQSLPSLITPYSNYFNDPLHSLSKSDMRLLEPADLRQPESDFNRLFSDSLLNRALTWVPPFIRTAEAGRPPPFIYARLMEPPMASHQGKRIGNQDLNLSTLLPISYVSMSITHSSSDKGYALAEIGLLDIHKDHIQGHSRLLGHTLLYSDIPVLTARYLMHHFGFEIIPQEVYERTLRHAPAVDPVEFSTEQLDLILMYKILHECAEILWDRLPDEMKARWKILFPLAGNDSRSATYFRNLIRIYSEGHADDPDPMDFFASETFADALGFYWMDEISDIHRSQNQDILGRYDSFFEEVMEWAQRRRETHGSCFILT